MPELHFELRWTDAHTERYYSPSTAVRGYLQAGESYSVPELLERARTAMHLASERVRARYGFSCSSAMDTLLRIEQSAERYAQDPTARVTVIAVE
jgi:uncharacterized repeat protein (TIGR04042 family)